MRVRAPSVIRFDRKTLLSEVVITNLRENEFCLWAILYIKTKTYTGTESNTVGVLPWSRFKIQHVLSLLFLFGQYGSRETPYPVAGRHQHRNWSTSARLTFSLRRTFDKWKHYSSVKRYDTLATAKGFPARGPLKPHWWAVSRLGACVRNLASTARTGVFLPVCPSALSAEARRFDPALFNFTRHHSSSMKVMALQSLKF